MRFISQAEYIRVAVAERGVAADVAAVEWSDAYAEARSEQMAEQGMAERFAFPGDFAPISGADIAEERIERELEARAQAPEPRWLGSPAPLPQWVRVNAAVRAQAIAEADARAEAAGCPF